MVRADVAKKIKLQGFFLFVVLEYFLIVFTSVRTELNKGGGLYSKNSPSSSKALFELCISSFSVIFVFLRWFFFTVRNKKIKKTKCQTESFPMMTHSYGTVLYRVTLVEKNNPFLASNPKV